MEPDQDYEDGILNHLGCGTWIEQQVKGVSTSCLNAYSVHMMQRCPTLNGDNIH